MCSKPFISGAVVIRLSILLIVLYAEGKNGANIRQIIGQTSIAPRLNQTVSSNTTAKPTTLEVCQDYNQLCVRWSRFGYCYNGYTNGYMAKVCKKTCGFCGHMSGECKDKYFYCPSWTRYYGSRAFACKLPFYKKRCPFTCDACKF